jgi:iron(III) transport system ATP-binding protein
MSQQPASVEFQQVVKRYGAFTAVKDVSFTIEPGTLVTLLGPSGCGKTTTLRLIAGLEMASAGRILIGGRDVTRLSAAERGVSMVFQSYALFPHMTVLENAAYGPLVSGIDKAKAEAMAAEKLKLMGLAGLEKRLPSELSGGQQQRVAVARALVLEPTVLLFDEPLSNLDAKLRRRVREDIRELQQSLKLTVVYVTHDQQEALAVSDRIIVMSNAEIAQSGSPRDLYERPANLFVADFIGDANVLEAEVLPLDDARAEVRLGNVVLELPRRGLNAGRARIAARPEALVLSDTAPATPALQGVIRKAAYLGTHMEYTVTTPQGEVFIVDPNVGRPLAIGSDAWIGFTGAGVTLVPGSAA